MQEIDITCVFCSCK